MFLLTTANSEFVSMGGREAEMTFGIGEFDYNGAFWHCKNSCNGSSQCKYAGKPNIFTFRCCVWTGIRLHC